MVDRDAELLRRTATILRFFGSADTQLANRSIAPSRQGGLGLLTSRDWEPFPDALSAERGMVHGTRFPREYPQEERMEVVLLVNLALNSTDVASLDVSDYTGWLWWDCLHGAPLKPSASKLTFLSSKLTFLSSVSVSVEAQGVGCIFGHAKAARPPALTAFLDTMRTMTHRKPLAGYSRVWRYLPQTRVVPAPRGAAEPAASCLPEGDCVRVPATTGRGFRFVSVSSPWLLQ